MNNEVAVAVTTMVSNSTTALPDRPTLVDPVHSMREVEAALLAGEGSHHLFQRAGDRLFFICATTGRGNEPVDGSFGPST